MEFDYAASLMPAGSKRKGVQVWRAM